MSAVKMRSFGQHIRRDFCQLSLRKAFNREFAGRVVDDPCALSTVEHVLFLCEIYITTLARRLILSFCLCL
jgi:hypothetical protein